MLESFVATEPDISKDVHLPDLRIKGFRGIKDLLISRLGRVTLLAGKNGTGKTTVLEAVRVYAARGRQAALADLLRNREEIVPLYDDELEREVLVPDWRALFYDRMLAADYLISIGPANDDPVSILMRVASYQPSLFPELQVSDEVLMIRVNFREFQQEFPTFLSTRQQRRIDLLGRWDPSAIQCESLGPGLPSNLQLAGFWDNVALTEEESRAVDALNLIYSGRVERVAMVGDDIGLRRSMGRRAIVKLHGEARPVPLKSLGDGAVRMFSVALALANSKDGFLLIDEAENGIHHSIQRAFWTMVLKAAEQNNVQVLATTHSWDCVAGFAMATSSISDVDGALVRLDRYGDRIKAVEYTEDDLRIAAKHGIEVR